MAQKKEDLYEHILAPGQGYLCKLCGRILSRKQRILSHLMTNHGKTAPKDGSCPLPPNQPICTELGEKPLDECATDQQCSGEERCCVYGCRLQCKKPVQEKAGSCPAVDRAACTDVTAAPAECHRDSQCPGSERCCCRNCTKACTETVTAHRGSCPKSPGHIGIGMACTKETVECSDDSNCTAEAKCCRVPPCTSKCVKAVADNPGLCPIDPGLENQCGPLAPPRCSSDADCTTSEKCCLFGCGMQCVKALPGHRGSCPKFPGLISIECVKENIQCTDDSNCTAGEKCCDVPECTTKCVKAVADHDGTCPSPKPVTCTAEPIFDCTHDSTCQDDEKCCEVGCRRKCLKSIKGKAGTCRPPPEKETPGEKCNKCNEDKDCPEDEKCCSGDQGRECRKPQTRITIRRAGDCPVPYEHCTDPPPYGHTCNHDGDCTKGEKCCVRRCDRNCFPAVPVKTKPGTCPVPYLKCYEDTDVCEHDNDCPGSKKCCYVRCGMQCAEPIKVHIGVCPASASCGWAFEDCDNDDDCWGYKRCCKFPCGAVCVLPVPENASP